MPPARKGWKAPAPPKTPLAYKQTMAEHRRRLSRIIDNRGVPQVKQLYDDAQARMLKRMAAIGAPRDTFTAQQHRSMLVQLRQGQQVLAKKMAGELGDIGRDAQVESMRGFTQDLLALERHFTGTDISLPIEEAARFRGIIDGRTSMLHEHLAKSLASWTTQQIDYFENEMAMSLMTGENIMETIDRVGEAQDTEWWRAERVVRTETAFAFNATNADAYEEAAKELPDLEMRWCEYVDDQTLVGKDQRVAPDSIIMHGQVVRPGELFQFPPQSAWPGIIDPEDKEVKRIPKHVLGGAWEAPPNRPNCRASISPWRPHWGVPGWRLDNGKRVPVQ